MRLTGNISKILGELITLIEDDKCLRVDLDLPVTLPHSRDTFWLPQNPHLLGTMNTADKSIALVDVALWRRFAFEELMPNFTDETCPYLPAEMRYVLKTLNQRIVRRKDRDHRHPFFRAVGDVDIFNRVFAKRIIQLQEYFYDDWESLRYVLWETENTPRFIVLIRDNSETGARNHWQWFRDSGHTLQPLVTLLQNCKIGSDAKIDDLSEIVSE